MPESDHQLNPMSHGISQLHRMMTDCAGLSELTQVECEIPLLEATEKHPAICLTVHRSNSFEKVLPRPQVNPKFLGAELHAAEPAEDKQFFVFSEPPLTDPLLRFRTDSMFFATEIRGTMAHALADTGASENFMSEKLADHLGLERHVRKRPQLIRIADGSIVRCSHFARTTVRIGKWSARMAFTIFPTGLPLVLGMPFFVRFEPQMLWRT